MVISSLIHKAKPLQSHLVLDNILIENLSKKKLSSICFIQQQIEKYSLSRLLNTLIHFENIILL